MITDLNAEARIEYGTFSVENFDRIIRAPAYYHSDTIEEFIAQREQLKITPWYKPFQPARKTRGSFILHLNSCTYYSTPFTPPELVKKNLYPELEAARVKFHERKKNVLSKKGFEMIRESFDLELLCIERRYFQALCNAELRDGTGILPIRCYKSFMNGEVVDHIIIKYTPSVDFADYWLHFNDSEVHRPRTKKKRFELDSLKDNFFPNLLPAR